MTVLGKILVFVNLVFSLLTAGLIVMVYTTRTNWNYAYRDLSSKYTALGASSRAELDAATDLSANKEKQLQALLREKQALENAVKSEKDEAARALAELKTLTETVGKTGQNVQALVQELERRRDEVTNLQRLLGEKEKKISEIDAQMARLRDEAVQFRIQWEQARDRNEALRRENEGLVREAGELRRQLGGTATPAQSSPAGAGPTATAPADLRGTVQRVEGDLATITPGSDAGVAVGAELSVFRTQPRPEYLGTIKILAASPHEAVGRLQGPKRTQIRKGDEVGVVGGR
jgi:peptidoglycan hydrolase CwlO-like protein